MKSDLVRFVVNGIATRSELVEEVYVGSIFGT
jgi:hypothetical protein